MPAPIVTRSRPLTRADLARFIPDHRAMVAFEALTADVGGVLPKGIDAAAQAAADAHQSATAAGEAAAQAGSAAADAEAAAQQATEAAAQALTLILGLQHTIAAMQDTIAAQQSAISALQGTTVDHEARLVAAGL